jgi:hypothetical protein
LSISKTVYVFRCGTSGLYALTTDRSGEYLPVHGCCPAGWGFERSIAIAAESSTNELVRATLSAIAKQGYYLSHAAISGLPLTNTTHSVERSSAF